MGSKNRHAKEILEIVLKNRKDGQYYVEPFVGGFNIIDKVSGKRIGNDIHHYLIELFRAVQGGWQPPDFISYEQYQDIRKHSSKYSDALVGFVGFGCSYSGKWWGGYARGNDANGTPRNYCAESKRNILSQHNGLQGIEICNTSYSDLIIPENSIIYCDPPYAGATMYKDKFDHNAFWKWCEEMSLAGHDVFVSEYRAPSGWTSVWQKEVHNTLVQDTGSKSGVENLFVFNKNRVL